jgi:large subunit ribosomal protein L31
VKKKIHPEYKETQVVCACGNIIRTRSTKENIHVEICSKCHPFYTGKQKLVDSAGMVERFQKRYAKKKEAAPKAEAKTDQAGETGQAGESEASA